MKSWRWVAGFAAIVALMMWMPIARADDNAGGISVSGTGTVKGKPSVVEIQATISGDGELANDASVKYRDLKKKAIAAFDALKNPDLSVEFQGSSVTEAVDAQAQMRIMQGMAGDPGKSKVRVSEELHLRLKGADKLDSDKLLDTLFKIIDAGRDAGVQIGQPGPTNYYQMQIRAQEGSSDAIAQFKIPDITSLQDQAYKLAVDDARAKAEKLAELSGVKLGRVISVQDEAAAAPVETNGASAQQPVKKEVSSGNFGEIPVTVRLQVVFEIQK